jgi:hypothetical protein
VVEEGDCVLGLLPDVVGFGPGEVGAAAPPGIEAQEAYAGEIGCDVVEVAPVPGEAGKGEDGQAFAFVGEEELGAVRSGEAGRQAASAASAASTRARIFWTVAQFRAVLETPMPRSKRVAIREREKPSGAWI